MSTQTNRHAWIVGAVGLALFLTLPPGAAAQETNRVAEGARIYGAACGRCHNPRSPLEREDRAWVTIVNHMRVRANLTGQEARSVLAFLQATNSDPAERRPLAAPAGGGAAASESDAVARGRALVSQRACVGCHVIGNAGGQVGPTLNGVVRRRGVEFVREKVEDPTFNNATSMMPNFDLAPEEIEAIIAYLRWLDGQ